MAISPVQVQVFSAYGGTLSSNVTSGNLILVWTYGFNGGQTAIVTSNRTTGNFTQIKAFEPRGADSYGISLFWALATSTGSCTISISGLSGSLPATKVQEWTGVNQTTPFDSGASASGVANGTTKTTGLTLTPSNINSLVIADFICLASGSGSITGIGSGNSAFPTSPLGNPQNTYEIPGNTSAVTLSATQNSAQGWAGVGATFLPQPQAAAPIFNPNGGTFTSAQTVTITSATGGSTIFYTTDGSTPTHSSSSISNGGTVSVTQSLTLKAIAALAGDLDSTVSSASFTITADIASLSLGASTIVAGGTTLGTVTLTMASLAGGTVVNLSSLNTGVATVSSSTITIPQGQSSGTFTVTGVGNGSTQIQANVISTFQAPIAVEVIAITALTILNNPVTYPTIASAMISLNPAPPTNFVVNLSSNNTGVATVPATITIPAGTTLGYFTITPQNSTGTAQITASATATSAFANLQVNAAINTSAPPPQLVFSKRTTAAAAMFPCIFIASPQGAQAITAVVSQVSALSLAYSQLINIYPALIHQDTANNDADLDVQINAAVTAVTSLNTIMQGLTVNFLLHGALAQMQIVVANALQSLLNAQANESLPDPD